MKRHWAQRFFELAHVVAGWSKDPECKVGAVLVSPDKRQASWGFNGFPASIEDTDVRLMTSDLKLEYMVHAELNAILNARRDVSGWWMFVTQHPCQNCAKAIIQAGIEVVVCPPPKKFPSKWMVQHQLAESTMTEAGLHIQHMKPPSSSPDR